MAQTDPTTDARCICPRDTEVDACPIHGQPACTCTDEQNQDCPIHGDAYHRLDDVALDEYLDGPEPEWDTEPEPPPGAIQANGLLRRVARIRAERQRDARMAHEQIEQIARWVDRRDAPRVRQESWLLSALERYHQAVLTISPDRKTIALPAGELVSRMGQAEWIATAPFAEWVLPAEAQAALALAEQAWVNTVHEILAEHSPLPGALVVKQPPLPGIGVKPMKDALTRRDEKNKVIGLGYTADGVRPPGLEVKAPERGFDIRIAGPEAEEPPPLEYPDPEAHDG